MGMIQPYIFMKITSNFKTFSVLRPIKEDSDKLLAMVDFNDFVARPPFLIICYDNQIQNCLWHIISVIVLV